MSDDNVISELLGVCRFPDAAITRVKNRINDYKSGENNPLEDAGKKYIDAITKYKDTIREDPGRYLESSNLRLITQLHLPIIKKEYDNFSKEFKRQTAIREVHKKIDMTNQIERDIFLISHLNTAHSHQGINETTSTSGNSLAAYPRIDKLTKCLSEYRDILKGHEETLKHEDIGVSVDTIIWEFDNVYGGPAKLFEEISIFEEIQEVDKQINYLKEKKTDSEPKIAAIAEKTHAIATEYLEALVNLSDGPAFEEIKQVYAPLVYGGLDNLREMSEALMQEKMHAFPEPHAVQAVLIPVKHAH